MKYPLITCTDDEMLKRLYGEHWRLIRCPVGMGGHCSISCAYIGVIDNDNNDLPALVCKQGGELFVPLGLVDVDTFDLDLLGMLRAGSDLNDHLRATQETE